MQKVNKIDWDIIFNGEEHLLIEGIDYKRTFSFSKYLYQKARERNIRIRQKISADGKSILVQVRNNELAVSKNIEVIEGEIEPDQKDIKETRRSYIHGEDEYPFAEWFNTLFRGGEKEVEANKLDEYGNPIPIMREFPGGMTFPTGEYVKEKKIVKYSPRYVLELERHKDFTGSPSKMADLICRAAKATGMIDVRTLDIDYKSDKAKREDLLIIRAGPIAEKYIERKKCPDKFDLFSKYNVKIKVPLPREKAEKWVDDLLRDGQLLLWEGRDYVGDYKILLMVLRDNFPDVDFYAKQEKDSKTGWVTLLITVRLPMLVPLQQQEGETGAELLKRWEEMPEGKRIEQKRDKLRLEYEERKLLSGPNKEFLDKWRGLQLEKENVLSHAPEKFKQKFLENIKEKESGLQEEFAELLSEEEIKLIQQNYDKEDAQLVLKSNETGQIEYKEDCEFEEYEEYEDE